MRLLMLGPIQVGVHHRPVRLGSGRRRAILAALALHRGVVISPPHLIGLVWAEDPPVRRENPCTATSPGCGMRWARPRIGY